MAHLPTLAVLRARYLGTRAVALNDACAPAWHSVARTVRFDLKTRQTCWKQRPRYGTILHNTPQTLPIVLMCSSPASTNKPSRRLTEGLALYLKRRVQIHQPCACSGMAKDSSLSHRPEHQLIAGTNKPSNYGVMRSTHIST